MQPRFYLSNKTNKEGRAFVMLYLSSHGKRITISTGKLIKPINWNEKAQEARGNTKEALDFNNYLLSYGANAVSILSELIENNKPEIVSEFKQKLKETDNKIKQKISNNLKGEGGTLLSFIESHANATSKSQQTKGQYLSTLKLLKEFQNITFKKAIDFETIDLIFYNDFINYCQRDKNYSTNTIGKYIKNIKYFMGEAEAMDLHQNFKFKSKKFKKLTEESFSIALSEKEIEELYKFDFTGQPYKEKVRDLFVASCWLGLRVSDLLAIKKEHIHNGTISIRMTKTKEFVDIPIFYSTVKKILKKYNGQLPNNILPQKYNEALKDITRDAGLVEEVAYTITKGGKQVEEIEPLYKLISSHTGRRSFATNLYSRDIPIKTIMAITGHRTEKSFRIYVKANRQDALNSFKKLHKKFN